MRKTNLLLNLISQQPDIGLVYLYTKDPYKAKYKFLIKKRKIAGLTHFNDSKAFIEYSMIWMISMKTFKNTAKKKKCKILVVFDDMIADMLSNKKN